MGLLMLRLIEMVEEHELNITLHNLCVIHDSLDSNKKYTYDGLLKIAREQSPNEPKYASDNIPF